MKSISQKCFTGVHSLIVSAAITLAAQSHAMHTAVNTYDTYGLAAGQQTIFDPLLMGAQVTTGDYSFNGRNDDRRIFIAIGTPANEPIRASGPNTNNNLRFGMQVANLGSNLSPEIAQIRLVHHTPESSRVQTLGRTGEHSHAASTRMRVAHVVTVQKADFLNGLDRASSVRLANIPDSALAHNIGLAANSEMRLVVRNGNQWYVSSSSRNTNGILTVNGGSERWHPFDPSQNIFASSEKFMG